MHSHNHVDYYQAPEDLKKAVDKILAEEGVPEILYFGMPGHMVFKKLCPDGETTELPLEPSLKLENHSPTGFCWGYGGSGPTQLAIALLLDATSNPTIAVLFAYDFKMSYVSRWPYSDRWSIYRSEIFAWLTRARTERFASQQSRN